MKIAFIGTGFVADYYALTLANHPELELAGAWDRDAARLARFCGHWKVKPYASEADCLTDPDVLLVVNLTTPESHHHINMAALSNGKHVYCEKPLALDYEAADEVVSAAANKGLTVCSAPANALGDAASETLRLVTGGMIGTPRLVYAEMEDGPVFRANWRDWKSISGTPWPGEHEFAVGCTLEHSGYALSWLLRLFGPVRELTAASALAFSDKGVGIGAGDMNPDFSVGVLKFDGGTTARLTCGLMQENDRSFTIHGEKGSLVVSDLWANDSRIVIRPADGNRPLGQRIAGKAEAKTGKVSPVRVAWGKRHRYPSRSALKLPSYPSRIDFAAGIAAQARMIAGGPDAFFSGKVALHMTEIALALNSGAGRTIPQSGF